MVLKNWHSDSSYTLYCLVWSDRHHTYRTFASQQVLKHIPSFLTNSCDFRPISELTWQHRVACSLSWGHSFRHVWTPKPQICLQCLIVVFPSENWLKAIIRVLTRAVEAIVRVSKKNRPICQTLFLRQSNSVFTSDCNHALQ